MPKHELGHNGSAVTKCVSLYIIVNNSLFSYYIYFIVIMIVMYNNKRWLYVSGLDVLGQSPRHNICAFIELSCYLDCFIKIAYIMLNIYSDSDILILIHFSMQFSFFIFSVDHRTL